MVVGTMYDEAEKGRHLQRLELPLLRLLNALRLIWYSYSTPTPEILVEDIGHSQVGVLSETCPQSELKFPLTCAQCLQSRSSIPWGTQRKGMQELIDWLNTG